MVYLITLVIGKRIGDSKTITFSRTDAFEIYCKCTELCILMKTELPLIFRLIKLKKK